MVFVGGSMTFDKMDQIREQQEQLARLHFEMDIQQDMQRSVIRDLCGVATHRDLWVQLITGIQLSNLIEVEYYLKHQCIALFLRNIKILWV